MERHVHKEYWGGPMPVPVINSFPSQYPDSYGMCSSR